MKKWMWIALLAWQAQASTFVGNGGGAGDVELAVTKRRVKEAMTAVERHGGEGVQFCQCNPTYESRNACAPLSSLTDAQKQFCTEALRRQAPQVRAALLNLNIRWTHEPITVTDRGYTRAVDAVTDKSKSEMTINLPRFLELQQVERDFLLTHETLHLTELDGQPMVDEGEVGPFSGNQGGRHLLDAMGSAAAILPALYPAEFKNAEDALKRPQAWKPWWIEFQTGKSNNTNPSSETFGANGFVRQQLKVRRNFGKWALIAGYTHQSQSKKALGVVDVDEQANLFTFGAGYRFFFFQDPATFWGQTHLLLEGLVETGSAKISLTDPLTRAKSKADVRGGAVQATYYVPFVWGLWLDAGIGYQSIPYKYKDVNLQYKNGSITHHLGVSYAF